MSMRPESASGASDPTGDEAERLASLRTRIVAWLGDPEEGLSDETRPTPALVSSLARVFSEGEGRRPEVGGRLGRYRLLDFVGQGGMSAVYAAVDQETGLRVALKVAPKAQPARELALRNEAEHLPRARHPHVVALRDVGEDERWFWIALDLHEGPSLASRLKRKDAPETHEVWPSQESHTDAATSSAEACSPLRRFEPRQVMTWFRDLAGALGALHGAGLIHRDVKPSNIVFGEDGRPVLIDFGLAKAVGEFEVESFLVGTLPYMSPEQTQAGFSALERTSDVYSLAMSMHEALTGGRFALGRDRHEIIQRVAFIDVPPPSLVARAVPPTLDPIFQKALAKHPGDRYASAADLVEDIDLWLAGKPLAHAREPLALKVRRNARRHPVATLALALLVLGLPAWLGADAIAARRDRVARLGTVRELLDRHQDVEALEVATAAVELAPDDDETRALHRLAIERAAPLLTRRLLEVTVFTPSWDAERLPHRPHVAHADAQIAREPHPHFVFQAAFGRYLEQSYDEARALIEAHSELEERSPLLRELLALVLLLERDFAAYEKSRHENPAAALAPEAICLRALRHYHETQLSTVAPELRVDHVGYERARARLDDLIDTRPEDLLARSVRVIVRIDQDDLAGALEDLAFVEPRVTDAQRPAIDAWVARALALSAAADDDAAWERVQRRIDAAVAHHPRYLGWFAQNGIPSELEPRLRFCRVVFTSPAAAELDRVALPWRLVTWSAQQLLSMGRPRDVLALLETVAASSARPREEGPRTSFEKARTLGVWARLALSPDDVGDPCEDAEEAARLRALVAIVDGREGASWEDRAAAAIARARLVIIDGGDPTTDAEPVFAEIDALISPEEIEAACRALDAVDGFTAEQLTAGKQAVVALGERLRRTRASVAVVVASNGASD